MFNGLPDEWSPRCYGVAICSNGRYAAVASNQYFTVSNTSLCMLSRLKLCAFTKIFIYNNVSQKILYFKPRIPYVTVAKSTQALLRNISYY